MGCWFCDRQVTICNLLEISLAEGNSDSYKWDRGWKLGPGKKQLILGADEVFLSLGFTVFLSHVTLLVLIHPR